MAQDLNLRAGLGVLNSPCNASALNNLTKNKDPVITLSRAWNIQLAGKVCLPDQNEDEVGQSGPGVGTKALL